MFKRKFFIGLSALMLVLSCREITLLGDKSPYETYSRKLRDAGLEHHLLARQWFEAGKRGLENPINIKLPYQEQGIFQADRPRADGYRFALAKGRKLEVSLTFQSAEKVVVFTELWSIQPSGAWKLLEYADSSGKINYEAAENLDLILRVQPELMSTVSYSLMLSTAPSLGFPVSGGTINDIGSVWGDPRDGGGRKHEGVDIFGKLGTPVVAAANGRIVSVREGGLGGKTVWVKPSGKAITIYYAHLDKQLVTLGERVARGDTLGLMGNTGNARTTPPHLHFGIYDVSGAINPRPYIDKREIPASIKTSKELIGQQIRLQSKHSFSNHEGTSDDIGIHTYGTVISVTNGFYKILLPDHGTGFLPVKAITGITQPIKYINIITPAAILTAPDSMSAIITTINKTEVAVLAYFNNYALVKTDSIQGWLQHNILR